MELRQLEYVVAVVDRGTFTAAAAAVHITQPSLSQGIRALENELGVDLFHRVGRRAVLSAAGEAFVAPARQALRDAETARAAAAAVRGLAGGRLDIASLPTLAVEPLAGWVGAFRQRHPAIDVVISEPETASAVTDLVREGRCEVGLAELPVPPDLAGLPVADQELVAVAPVDIPLRVDRPVPLARLARFPLVSTPSGTSTRRLVDAAFADAGASPRVAVETSNREALVALVAAGAGITFLPRPVAEAAVTAVTTVVVPSPRIRRHVGVAHRRGPLSPAARAFLEVISADGG